MIGLRPRDQSVWDRDWDQDQKSGLKTLTSLQYQGHWITYTENQT